MRFLPGFYDLFDDWMTPTTNAMQCDIKEGQYSFHSYCLLP